MRMSFWVGGSLLILGAATLLPVPGGGAPQAVAADEAAEPKKGVPLDPDVKLLELRAQRCRTAEEALILYKVFALDPTRSPEVLMQIQPKLEYWKSAAKQDLVRTGRKWVTRAEAEKARQKADAMVTEAMSLVRLGGNLKQAENKLSEASKVCPDHLWSLFMLGIGSYVFDRPDLAERHFQKCAERAPEHIATLNNLALCQMTNRKHEKAVKNWEKAARLDPSNQHLVQNIGKYVAESSYRRVDKKTAAKAGELYASLVKTGHVAEADAYGEFRFLTVDNTYFDDGDTEDQDLVKSPVSPRPNGSLPTQPKPTQPKPTQPKPTTPKPPIPQNTAAALPSNAVPMPAGAASLDQEEQNEVFNSGTGFVVHPGYVLTSRHVIERAASLIVQDPAHRDEPLLADVVGVSPKGDWALLKCTELKAAPLPLRESGVAVDTELLGLGFSVSSPKGNDLQVVAGNLLEATGTGADALLLLSQKVRLADTGGPLCDETGAVVGMLMAKTFSEQIVRGQGLARPMSTAVPFLRTQIPGFATTAHVGTSTSWSKVEETVKNSIVVILVVRS